MSSLLRSWLTAVLLLVLLVSGCGSPSAGSPVPTREIITVSITPESRPATLAVTACSATLPGAAVRIEEAYPAQASGDLLIRLGEPDSPPAFAAQIAEEELVVILNPDNPAASLTPDDIQALFGGQIIHWSNLGGAEAAVAVWSLLPAGESRLVFEQSIMQGVPFVSSASLAPDPQAMQQAVLADRNAIGFLPRATSQPELTKIGLGIRLPVLVTASQQPVGTVAEMAACLQGEIGQQALAPFYP